MQVACNATHCRAMLACRCTSGAGMSSTRGGSGRGRRELSAGSDSIVKQSTDTGAPVSSCRCLVTEPSLIRSICDAPCAGLRQRHVMGKGRHGCCCCYCCCSRTTPPAACSTGAPSKKAAAYPAVSPNSARLPHHPASFQFHHTCGGRFGWTVHARCFLTWWQRATPDAQLHKRNALCASAYRDA